jgi:Tfp pilus assembly protein PilW
MHGMLSAAILIGVFVLTAVVCLYLAVRAFAAGRAQTQAHTHGQAHGQAGRRGDASLP